jgi:hypothetical protein
MRLTISKSVAMLALSLGLLLGSRSGASAATYYVATNGSDSNPGTDAAPFRTIQKAADIVNPGDTVLVNDGVYTSAVSDTLSLWLRRGGTASSPITFRSRNPLGAVVDGGANADRIVWYMSAANIRVEGFKITGGSTAFSTSSANNQFVGNHVYNVGRLCSGTSLGFGAIFVDGPGNLLVERNIFENIGRLGPGENGCNPPNDYYKNHDHGIYVKGAPNVTIINNIFLHHRAGWPIHVYPDAVSNLKILNNTFGYPNPYRAGHILIAAALSNSLIQNNIFYQPTSYAVDICCSSAFSNVQITNNLTTTSTFNGSSPAGVTFSANRVNTDPQFVDAPAKNFRLQSSSPAIDLGITLTQVPTDLAGTARPQKVAYDVGAYEYRTAIILAAPSNLRMVSIQ